MIKERNFTKATPRQLQLMQECLDSLKSNTTTDLWDCSVEDKQVYDFNGTLSFTLRRRAKSDESVLSIYDSMWLVTIGRRGKVESIEIGFGLGNEKRKANPNLRFY